MALAVGAGAQQLRHDLLLEDIQAVFLAKEIGLPHGQVAGQDFDMSSRQ